MLSGRATASNVRAWVTDVFGVMIWAEMCLPLKPVGLPSLPLESPPLCH